MAWKRRFGKYNAKKTEVDGIIFDSKTEAEYYLILKGRLERGEISSLQRQVPYELIPKIMGEKVKHLKTKDKIVPYVKQGAVVYIADFVYRDNISGTTVIEDVKGFVTPEYRLKKAMMLYLKGLEVMDVTSKDIEKMKKAAKEPPLTLF